MGDLIQLLQSFPPPQTLNEDSYDEKIKSLRSTIKQFSHSKLTSDVSGGGSILDVRKHFPILLFINWFS